MLLIKITNSQLKKLYIFLMVTFSFTIFLNEESYAQNQSVIIANPTAFTRNKEIISIKKTDLGNIKDSLYPSVKMQNQFLVTQTIDTNNDGFWDELLVEVSLSANAKGTLQINWLLKKEMSFPKRTNVQLSLRSDTDVPSPEINDAKRNRGFVQNIANPFYQMEGPGFENDKVAFRAFFDSRNGKDIYGKIVEEPILEKVGVGASWHNLQSWGMDILKVGNSLGAGALAVKENNKIYRLGDADSTTFQVLYEGPLQAAFKLGFTNWDVANAKQNGSETLTITKGNFYYQNEVSLALNKFQNLVTGFANFIDAKVLYKKYNTHFSSISTYGKQADGSDSNLGMAIVFSTKNYLENKMADQTTSIPNTSYVALKPRNKTAIYFFAGWEKSDNRFTTQQGFENYVELAAKSLSNPIKIKTIKNKN
jgi:hypothetical protein